MISWNVSAELDSGYEQAKKVSGLCPSNHDQPDAWNFAVCNCTSYVAYRLNLSGVQFTNQYGGVAKWGNANLWDDSDRAGMVGIRIDQYPAVGSVAQWNSYEPGAGSVGHVAFVYKINVHSDGSLASVEIAEYNGKGDWLYQTRTLIPGENKYPGRFLHFEDKVGGDISRATCITKDARALPGDGYCPFCWVHGQYSALCEHATNWYYFDQKNGKFYTLSSSSCPTSPIGSLGSQGGGYGTILDENALQSGSGGVEVFNPPPITGGKHPGDLPNLIVHELYLVKEADRDSPHLSQIHIGERSYCNIQVKNTGEAGAWGTWANRCYLSKGNYRDHDPDNLGHESMTDLSAGQSRRVYQIIPAFEYPGKFNITACADTDGNDGDKKIAESDEGDNCHDEYRFDVVSDPDVAVTNLNLGEAIFDPNEAFTFEVTVANLGENFGPDVVRISYAIDGVFVGFDQVRRENLKGGMTKVESVDISQGVAEIGVHAARACIDYDSQISETNETNDCRESTFLVRDMSSSPVTGPDPNVAPLRTPSTKKASPAALQLLFN
ncbi:MAG: CHAP domain-containing protein [Candidatus Moraniibacteriota bacterium]|nr:MAG: CHAP domain-containing protein [Candidatus Moranbacteria bacterium]